MEASAQRTIHAGTDMNFISDPKVFFENDFMKWDFSFARMIFITAYLFERITS
jgi:hypothetical protein